MKWINKITEAVDGEVDDYSYFNDREVHFEEEWRGNEYYNYDFRIGKEVRTVRLRTDGDNIEVCLGEDSWEQFREWDYRVKYFWMALLKW